MRLIDADVLKEQFTNECLNNCYYCKLSKWDKKRGHYNCGLIDNAPTVDRQTINAEWLKAGIEYSETHRPQGEWKQDEDDNSLTCSGCGCRLWANDIIDGEAYFCPNCGADMRKGGNE
jgi:hypothetical protein